MVRPFRTFTWTITHLFLVSLLSSFALTPTHAETRAKLHRCLTIAVESSNYEECIRTLASPCIEKASNTPDALTRINKIANCYNQETEIWQELLSRAAKSWRENASAKLYEGISASVSKHKMFAASKCGVFDNAQYFGTNGQILSARCKLQETARMAIFIGYELD